MNSAFVCDGAFVEIEPGVVVNRPIELLFISATGGEGMLALPRNLVLLRAGSQATLHERYMSARPVRVSNQRGVRGGDRRRCEAPSWAVAGRK